MDTKLYVGNLSYDTTEDDLRQLFSSAGSVQTVSLIKDRDTGRSKGFAFVEMSTQDEAEQAIKSFNGSSFGDREIKVNIARPPEPRPSFRYDNRYDNRSRSGGSKDRRRGKGSSRRY